MKKIAINLLVVFTLLSSVAFSAVKIIPAPQEIVTDSGSMPFDATSKIVYADTQLANIANVLADNIERIHSFKPIVEAGTNAPLGSLLIKISDDAAITGNIYKLTIADSATLEAKNNSSISYGCVTFLQAINNGGIERVTITDWPNVYYRSLMVDIARQWHTVENIKQVIDLAHLYKVKFLQLHLSDNQSWTFPSTKYPELQGPDNRWYTLEQWRDMVSYAGHRNVVLIPEIDVPGHSGRACKAMPDLFGRLSTSVIDFGNPTVWNAVSNIVLELCDVFTNSPYIHLGGDEVDWGQVPSGDPTNVATIAKYDLGNTHGMFNFFFGVLDDVIQSQGRKTILWESSAPTHYKFSMPQSITYMMFDNYVSATTYLNAGHDVINASWFPLYVLYAGAPSKCIYDWDLFTFGNYTGGFPRRYTSVRQYTVEPTPKIPGAQVCIWEQAGDHAIPALRHPLPTASERLWNTGSTASFADYTNRLSYTDGILQKLMAVGTPDQVNPSASTDVYNDKIFVVWHAAEDFPTKYRLLRSTQNDSGTAEVIFTDSPETSYEDTSAIPNTTYYYWVQSGNMYGYADVGNSASGRKGNTAVLPVAYEGFDYSPNKTLAGFSGGAGWSDTWSSDPTSVSSMIKDDNLTYPGLYTSGKCLHMQSTGLTDPQSGWIRRNLEHPVGVEGSELWVSYLLKPINLEEGDFSIYLADLGIRKRWGNGLYLDGGYYVQIQPVNDVTYFVVSKTISMNGNDLSYLWVNPVIADGEPSIQEPGISISQRDIRSGTLWSLSMQYHNGNNSYDFDEFRVASSWQELIELGKPIEEPPATPENLTATDGDYSDKIVLAWDYTSHTDNFALYRNTADNSATSVLISDTIVDTEYIDTNITNINNYFYWVKSGNSYGRSDFSSVAEGSIDTNYYQLTVVLGSGSGIYQPGTKVNLSANPPPVDQIFNVWSGDTANIDNLNLADTFITMPNENTSISATYMEAPITEVIYEGFASSIGTTVIGSSGGTGWPGSLWQEGANLSEENFVAIDPLSYTDEDDNVLLVSGNAAAITRELESPSEPPTAFRTLESTIDTGIIFFSFLTKPEDDAAKNSDRFYIFGDSINLRVRGTWGGTQPWRINGDNATTITSPATGETQFIVGRLNFITETFDLWKNPNLVTPEEPDFTYDMSGDLYVDRFSVGAKNQSVGMTLTVDEVRFGNKWVDVTPVPEPALGFLGLLALVAAIKLRK